jgi:hypothetical protein
MGKLLEGGEYAPHELSNTSVRIAEVWLTAITGGWSVGASFNAHPLVFLSGAHAEQAARRLTRAAVESGLTVELLIRTRDGTLAKQARYGAQLSPHLYSNLIV